MNLEIFVFKYNKQAANGPIIKLFQKLLSFIQLFPTLPIKITST